MLKQLIFLVNWCFIEPLKCPQDCSKTSLYVAVAILLVIIAVLVAVIVYLSRYHPKFQNSSKDDVTPDVQNKGYREDAYDEVQTSPSPAGLNLGNDTPCTYEDLHHPVLDGDSHVYQPLKKTTRAKNRTYNKK